LEPIAVKLRYRSQDGQPAEWIAAKLITFVVVPKLLDGGTEVGGTILGVSITDDGHFIARRLNELMAVNGTD
jgi:hypothetical protein